MFRKGFSLIEVNMAILIAAGGLLSLFALFPVGLRQSEMSSEDLYQSTYAESVFQMFSGNVATISDINDWNDIDTFWSIATEGTGIKSKLLPARRAFNKIDSLIRDDYLDFQLEGNSGEQDNVWYAGTDFDEAGGFVDQNTPSLPEQFIIRVYRKKGTGVANKNRELVPAVYVVTFASTSVSPSIYYQNTPYSMEFSFYGKVWAAPPPGASSGE